MIHRITLTKSGKVIDCDSSETILEAMQRAGLDVPYSCQGGTCGTCMVKAEGPMDCEEMLALTGAQMDAGWRLTCVARPMGDCKIEA